MCDYDMYQMILYTTDINCFTFIWHIMIIFMIYDVDFSFCWFNLEDGWYSLELNIWLKF